MENGRPKYEVSAFEKHADFGLWFPSSFGEYSIDDNEDPLRKAVEKW
jgi:hypothetical protein